MIEIRRHNDLGTMKIDWLDARYHFSFANYFDPQRMGLGPLRVINDDIVKVGGGFDFHPHRDMEIITYVRKGAVTHEDSLGNKGVTKAGEIQVMSAGTGIVHAEFNQDDEDINLYQIWIQPREQGVAPRWEQRAFPQGKQDALTLLASGLSGHQGQALMIHQDVAIYGGNLAKNAILTQPLEGAAYLLVSKGEISLNNATLKAGDAAILKGEKLLSLKADADSELVLIDLPTVH